MTASPPCHPGGDTSTKTVIGILGARVCFAGNHHESYESDEEDDLNLLSKVFFCTLKLPSHSMFFGRNFTSLKPILPLIVLRGTLGTVFLFRFIEEKNLPISRPGKNCPLKKHRYRLFSWRHVQKDSEDSSLFR